MDENEPSSVMRQMRLSKRGELHAPDSQSAQRPAVHCSGTAQPKLWLQTARGRGTNPDYGLVPRLGATMARIGLARCIRMIVEACLGLFG